MTIAANTAAHDLIQGNLAQTDSPSLGKSAQIKIDPLPASPIGQAAIPVRVDVRLTANDTEPLWRVGQLRTGYVAIDLGNQYLLSINEYQGEVVIDNHSTGETTRIWGNAQVDVDGVNNFQFWGTTTFILENKVKVTATTIVSETNPNAYILDKLVIIKSNRAIIFSGAGSETIGDMKIRQKRNAVSADLDTPDNFILQQNKNGPGWIAQNTGEIAKQEDLRLTAPGNIFGMKKPVASLHELSQLFSRFLAMANISLVTRAIYSPIESQASDDAKNMREMAGFNRAIEGNDNSGKATYNV